MALSESTKTAFEKVGTDVKELRTRVGALADLDTTAKGSIVAAINECHKGHQPTKNTIDNLIAAIGDVNIDMLKAYNDKLA